ncbi:uncharacterized protein LACBIDRAFT_333751 [Laccaria bicolor S238N-H82]|uniref:Predicted protein n=1 Tax=Laccaria bicolor (strain S238N-H82 / ATCC MYA-4686) TaxID=486041 RepID=B0DWY5_LACBS|nr:uncharacterized protein LACBIDRAFT_333751 [Laccaria bicolor S238N-H82]EDR00893.1 predicted protein [Laccaria bicolor S238N-H82]|eukprot:XP_001888487.1 predicted protein [Laccaria bicolor S238N-H82]
MTPNNQRPGGVLQVFWEDTDKIPKTSPPEQHRSGEVSVFALRKVWGSPINTLANRNPRNPYPSVDSPAYGFSEVMALLGQVIIDVFLLNSVDFMIEGSLIWGGGALQVDFREFGDQYNPNLGSKTYGFCRPRAMGYGFSRTYGLCHAHAPSVIDLEASIDTRISAFNKGVACRVIRYKANFTPQKALSRVSTNMQRGTSCELCLLPLTLCQCYYKPSQLSDGTGWANTMQLDTYCNLCLSPLPLCLCYSKLFQRAPPADVEIGTMEQPVIASPPYEHLMSDLLSGTQSFYNAVAVTLPLLIPEFGEGDTISPIGLRGHSQPPLLPTDLTISGVGAAGQLPRPVVASPAHVDAANRRRTSPRRFACGSCPQDFTAKHNLRS